jgi:hypothetical protein
MDDRMAFTEPSMTEAEQLIMTHVYNNDISAHARNKVAMGNNVAIDHGLWVDGFCFVKINRGKTPDKADGAVSTFDIVIEAMKKNGYTPDYFVLDSYKPYTMCVDEVRFELVVASMDNASHFESVRRSLIMTSEVIARQ